MSTLVIQDSQWCIKLLKVLMDIYYGTKRLYFQTILFVPLAHKENLWLDNPFLRLVMNIHRFHKEFKEIYVDQSIHLVDHFIIFIILIDASTRWTQVCLLSTSNIIFARLIAQIIRLRAQFPYYPIKTMRVNSVNILNL